MNWFVSVLIDGQYVEDLIVYLEGDEICMHNRILNMLITEYGNYFSFCREFADTSKGINAYWRF